MAITDRSTAHQSLVLRSAIALASVRPHVINDRPNKLKQSYAHGEPRLPHGHGSTIVRLSAAPEAKKLRHESELSELHSLALGAFELQVFNACAERVNYKKK